MIRSKNKRTAAWLRRALALVLAVLMLCGITVSAADMEAVPYYSYCFWEGPSKFEAVPMRSMYEPAVKIDGSYLGVSNLNNPRYITLSPDYQTLYILDSGNSRILAVDANNNKLIKEIGPIKYSKTDYITAKRVSEVKPNTEYVLLWWSKHNADEGNGRFSVSIKDNKSGAVISAGNDSLVPLFRPIYEKVSEDDYANEIYGAYSLDEATGRYVKDEKGWYNRLNEPTWYKNVMTFNSGAAAQVAIEFDHSTDERGEFFLDDFVLAEKSVLERMSISVEFKDPDGLSIEDVDDSLYTFVIKTKTLKADNTELEREYIYDIGFDPYAVSDPTPYYSILRGFNGTKNGYQLATAAGADLLSDSDYSVTDTVDENNKTIYTVDGKYSVNSFGDAAAEEAKAQAKLRNALLYVEKRMLQDMLFNRTATEGEAAGLAPFVIADDFDAGLTDWTYDVATHNVVEDARNGYTANTGSLTIETTARFTGANGMYVSKEGNLYIADTENERVMITDADGNLQTILTRPKDDSVPADMTFKPIRVMMDNKGYLFVAVEGGYYGMLAYDTEYTFLGFHGSFRVEQSVLDTIAGWIESLFMTNEKADQSVKKLPAAILDISIDKQGMMYTLSAGDYGQIKRLGLNGNQTLNHKFGFTTQSGDLVSFKENPASYYDVKERIDVSQTSFTVGPDNFIYILDQSRGRISMFDEECRSICTFGTGFKEGGGQLGTFQSALSIACGEDKLYVLDAGITYTSVTVFDRTEYGAWFRDANQLTIDGKYDEAEELWQKVLKYDANNQRAYEGMCKAMLQKADKAMDAAEAMPEGAERDAAIDAAKVLYERTMEYAELGNDQQTYSQAYEVLQKHWLTNNFWWVFIVCLLAVGGIVALLVLSKKRKIFEIKNVKVKTALSVPLHPIQAFNTMKYQKTGSVGLAALFVVLFYLASVSEDLYGGFMYVITDTANYNSLFTLIGSVGILLLWVIVNWGICILNEGKGTLKEVFTMSCYSMTPLIVYSVFYTVASHLIPASSTSTFGLIGTIAFIYTALLLLLGMTVVHEYTFFKAMRMAVMVILCMLLAAFVIFSVVLLSQQFLNFFVSLIEEITLR
ncbi:MAG: YIP1 family protein [Clostridia bacterium]|nr:YIP1 family protein [Clostridia bacterium]